MIYIAKGLYTILIGIVWVIHAMCNMFELSLYDITFIAGKVGFMYGNQYIEFTFFHQNLEIPELFDIYHTDQI